MNIRVKWDHCKAQVDNIMIQQARKGLQEIRECPFWQEVFCWGSLLFYDDGLPQL